MVPLLMVPLFLTLLFSTRGPPLFKQYALIIVFFSIERVRYQSYPAMPQFESDSSAYVVGVIVGLVGGLLIIVALYFILRGALGIAEQETADETEMAALRREAGVQEGDAPCPKYNVIS